MGAYLPSSFPGEDDLDILTALLAENEGIGEQQGGQEEQADDLEGLFDDDNDEGEEYKDGVEGDAEREDSVSELFGDVDDIEHEEKEGAGEACESLDRSKEDLQGFSCCGLSFTV